ncbi:hypothetical protein QYE76_067323 [Lolium multiflorum]|uniref:Reverse transcriptase domain-containing protein n=1 Tax=Lolium multiflorum TaxID=4521 RepID=A0AAD8WAV3_LOLMU|nr:hypothetical protein QYE76_067323 [Lolium multiflorum]
MMQKCLATQIGKNVQVYIDNVVITTKEGSTLIDDLRETFDNLDKFCLNLNPTKCSFGVPAGELLGFLVSARGIEANPEKIQAIVTMRKPTKLKEIQQLTGRVAALSRFVARLGERALPFYALIKQGEKFEWNEEADRAFEDLKRTISTPPILVAPKEKEPLLLYIAATPQVIHGQSIPNPRTRPIQSGTRRITLPPSEDDKSLTDGEDDFQFLVDGELEAESEDDSFSWDDFTSSDEEEEEESDPSSDEPPTKRFCFGSNAAAAADDDEETAPAEGYGSSDEELTGSSADGSHDGDDEGSDGP